MDPMALRPLSKSDLSQLRWHSSRHQRGSPRNVPTNKAINVVVYMGLRTQKKVMKVKIGSACEAQDVTILDRLPDDKR